MDITDLPNLFAAITNQEKLDRTNFIVESVNEGLMSPEQADIEIEKIIREKVSYE